MNILGPSKYSTLSSYFNNWSFILCKSLDGTYCGRSILNSQVNRIELKSVEGCYHEHVLSETEIEYFIYENRMKENVIVELELN